MFDFFQELLLNDFHSLVEKGILICCFLPPHGIDLGHSAPEGGGHCCYIFFVDLINSVVIGIHVNNQIFVDFLSDLLNYRPIEDGLERQFPFFSLEDYLDGVGDDFLEVEVYESCGGHAYGVVGIGALEFDLVVVEQTRRFVLSSHINNDIRGLPDCWVATANYAGVTELFGELTEKGAG